MLTDVKLRNVKTIIKNFSQLQFANVLFILCLLEYYVSIKFIYFYRLYPGTLYEEMYYEKNNKYYINDFSFVPGDFYRLRQ